VSPWWANNANLKKNMDDFSQKLYSSSVEQLPSKQWVAGSIPATKNIILKKSLKKY
jgi:hypothetical protein